MSRGEQEKACFSLVQQYLHTKVKYFGCSVQDIDNIEKIFKNSFPNPQSNLFPDFMFENGFVEHFQISSGRNTKNGSEHKRDHSKFDTDFREGEKRFKEELANNPTLGECKTFSSTMQYKNHSYDNLVGSLKNSWTHHINSMQKYDGNKEIGIVLIEYNEMGLTMMEDCFADCKSELRYGDLYKQEHINDYRISRDKNVLNYLYQYRDNIKYIVYICSHFIDIIATENIPEIIKLLPFEYRIAPLHIMETHSTYAVSVSNFDIKREEKNDQT